MSHAPTPPILLITPDEVEVFDRGNGVVTVPYVGVWNCETNHVTTGQTHFAVGTGLPLHSHNVEESVLVLRDWRPLRSVRRRSTSSRVRRPGCRLMSRTAS